MQEPVDLVLPEIVVVGIVEDAPPVQDPAVVRPRVEEVERQEIRLRASAAVSLRNLLAHTTRIYVRVRALDL